MPNVTASNEVALLRAELELLMTERENLLRTVGAASVFIANLDAETLPEAAWDAGDILAECLNDLPEDTPSRCARTGASAGGEGSGECEGLVFR